MMKNKKVCALTLAGLMFTSVLFSGCDNKSDVMDEYIDLVSRDTSLQNVIDAQEYLDKNIDGMNQHNADYMVQLFADFSYKYDNDSLDYNDFAEKYKKYTSDTLYRFYHDIKAEEQAHPVVQEGVLEADFEEIMKRALAVEQFITAEKEMLTDEHYTPIREDALWIYKYYINIMFVGSTANPLFSYETGEFSEAALESYASLAEKNPGTATAWAVEEFSNYLDSIGHRLNYNNSTQSKAYYDTCSYINSEAGKKLYEMEMEREKHDHTD